MILGLMHCAKTRAEVIAQAAEAGDPQAIYLVGIDSWSRGDKTEAVRSFKEAADLGDESAKGMLRNLSESGQLTPTGQIRSPDISLHTPSTPSRMAPNNVESSRNMAWSAHPATPARRATGEADRSKDRSTPRRLAAPFLGDSDDVIETTIKGEFNGWDGETVFLLSNGQIWQQDEYDYEYTYDYMPDVLIYRSKDGSWKMQVKGIDHSIEVRRLK
ncbi:MAG: sel1 repeat family protein [Holophagaceae bacterium]|nr:sel1 repeat family protein [Holophagaceae bacterium]